MMEIQSLRREYGQLVTVRDFNLSIPDNSVNGLAGDSYSNVVGVFLQLGVCAILLSSIRRLAPPAAFPAPVPTSGS